MNKASLLAALTTLAEEEFTHPHLSGPVILRELTARQIADAREAANQTDTTDTALWYATVVQMGVIDPDTKRQVFEASEVEALCDGRNLLVQTLATAILALAHATPKHMEDAVKAQTFRQRDAGEGAGDPEAGA